MLRTFIAGRLSTNTLLVRFLLLSALAATVAACGGNNDGDAGATTASDTTTAAAEQEWKKVVPGGDCECADGPFTPRRDSEVPSPASGHGKEGKE